MKSLLDSFIRPVLAAGMAIIVANCNDGCKPAQDPSVAAEYTKQVNACVADAKTLQESCWCRKAVDLKFGVCEQDSKAGRCSADCGSM